MEWERDILVHGLKSLEVEGVAGRGGFDAVRERYVDDVDKEGWGKEGNSIIIIVRMGKEVRTTREGIRSC